MKQRLKRIMALVLTASLVVPTSALPAQAAQSSSNVIFTEEETIEVNNLGEERSTLFNSGWKFFLGDSSSAQEVDFNDSDWRSVDLPHDYSIEQEFTTRGEAESGFLPGGTGWYRKSFTLPESCQGRNITVDFGGVYMNATVYVNGQKLGTHPYGYTGFAFDISDYVTCDGSTQNVIAVKVENKIPSSRWYSGSGIYRDVYFNVTDSVHVSRYGTTITTPDLADQKDGDVTVHIATALENEDTETASVTVRNTVYDSDGNPVSAPVTTEVSVNGEDSQQIAQSATVNKPLLWSVESPTLYYVRTEILDGEQLLDTYESEFGFRYIGTDTQTGFTLNGEKIKLKGVCMHHDQGSLGAKAYEDAIKRQVRILKEMGCNSIRVTHNPASDVLVKMCNKYGMLMIDEAFDTWLYAKNGNTNDYSAHFSRTIEEDNQIIGGDSEMTWAEYDMKEMVSRGKNAPSIIMWSLGNELMEGNSGDFSSYSDIAAQLIQWGKEIDDTRFYTFGDNKLKANWSEAFEISDVLTQEGGMVGGNYCDNSVYNSIHNRYPNYALYGSETASACGSRGAYRTKGTDSSTLEVTAYDKWAVGWGALASTAWFDVIRNDFIAGTYVWTGFDYIGEPTPWNGTGTGSVTGGSPSPNSSYFGIVDTAGFPKDDYYLYQSLWNEDVNTLHVLPCWDRDSIIVDNGNVEVVVYSDAAKVELYLNGEKIDEATSTVTTTEAGYSYRMWQGKTNASGLYPTFQVPYEVGTLQAKAYDANGQEITDTVGRSSVTTSDMPSRLELTDTYSYGDYSTIDADGYSLSYISVDVVDENGVLDPDAANEITFTVEGDGVLVGTDNGDQRDTTCYVPTSTTQTVRRAYNGKALAIVKSTTQAGQFKLTATADGLASDSITVTTRSIYDDEQAGIQSYRLAKHCYIRQGSESLSLPSTVSVTYLDGTQASLPVAWNSVETSQLDKVGNFNVTGTLQNTEEEITLTMTVHVYGNVVAAENYSAITPAGTIPSLPSVLKTYLGDGTAYEEFPVTWELSDVSEDSFSTAGTIVPITGTVTAVFGETYPVTASIRVAESIPSEIANIAPDYLELTESCSRASDTLTSITNGVKQSSESDTSQRWTNWWTRAESANPEITFTWATAHLVSQINLFYYVEANTSDSEYPTSVSFEYSIDGQTWLPVAYEEDVEETEHDGHIFRLKENINPIALKVILGHTPGNFVGLTEVEIMSPTFEYHANDSANLDRIEIDGTALEDFTPEVTDYTVSGASVTSASSDSNAAFTILPLYGNIVRILTTSEDQSASKVYTLTLDDLDPKVNYLKQVTLTAPMDTISVDDTLQLTAAAFNQDKEDVTNSCDISYQVTGSATCDETGLVTATGNGLVQVTASATLNGKTIASAPYLIYVYGADVRLDIPDITGMADSQEDDEELSASSAVDQNIDTHWHSSWTNNNVVIDPDNPENNQNNGYTIDLGGEYEVTRLGYVPRQGNSSGIQNGRIVKYRILYGTEPDNLQEVTLASDNTWADNAELKTAKFSPVVARYIRIEALSTVDDTNGNQFVSAAEFYLYKQGEPECICEISAPVFEGGEIQIPYYEDSVQLTLQASADLTTGCLVDGHEDPALRFVYEITNDENQSAEISDHTLTFRDADIVTVTAKAQAVAADGTVIKEASTSADYTVTKQATPAYTLTFEGGEGSTGTGPAPIVSTIGTKVTLPENTFEKEGFVFSGWDNGFTTYPAGASYTIGSRDVTFTAVWVKYETPSVKIENISGTADSEEVTQETAPGSYATDGDTATFWHSNWGNNDVTIDSDNPENNANNGYTIDLGDIYDVVKLEYLPRQDSSSNGRITSYRILYGTSADDITREVTLLDENTWANDSSLKTALFETVKARYIRIEALSTYSDQGANKFITAAEFYVYRAKDPIPEPECTCQITDLHFTGESVQIPLNSETAQITLEAAATLGGDCQVSGHGDAEISYAYEVIEDADQIVSTLDNHILTVHAPGTIQVKVTASANDQEASETATFTVTKEAAPQYQLTFTGGTGATGTAPSAITAEVGANVTLPANTFTKEGYLFKGWSDGINVYAENAPYTMGSRDVTFTAVWEQKDAPAVYYTLTFAGGEGASGIAPSSITAAAGTMITLPANTFAKEGYVFKAWSDGTNVYAEKASYPVGNKDITFTAVWEKQAAPAPTEPLKAPNAPTSLKDSANKPKSLKLSWSKVDQADGYRVYRYNKSKKSWEQIADTTSPSFKDTRRSPATIYRYKVTAYRKSGSTILESAFSSELKTATAPVKPSLKGTIAAGGRVKLTWPKKTATKYVVYMKKGNGKYKKLVTKKPKNSYCNKWLQKGVTYRFRVRAFKKVNGNKKIYSAYSRVIKVKR